MENNGFKKDSGEFTHEFQVLFFRENLYCRDLFCFFQFGACILPHYQVAEVTAHPAQDLTPVLLHELFGLTPL